MGALGIFLSLIFLSGLEGSWGWAGGVLGLKRRSRGWLVRYPVKRGTEK